MAFPYIDISNGDRHHVDGMDIPVVDDNGQKDQGLGTPKGIVFHWTAGDPKTCYTTYHYNIVYNHATGNASVVKTLTWQDKGAHIWGRNSNMVGISFCAMEGANPPASLSAPAHFAVPVMPAQIEAGSILAAEICAWKHLNPSGMNTLDAKRISGSSLVSTGGTIQAPVLTDHAFFARHDGYASDRWDIERYMAQVYAKANEYYRELKAGTRHFQYEALLK